MLQILYSIDTHFNASNTDSLCENIVGKEEIDRNKQFLLFPQWFLLNRTIVSQFVNIFYIISLFAAKLEEPKIDIWVKRLTNKVSHLPLKKNHQASRKKNNKD